MGRLLRTVGWIAATLMMGAMALLSAFVLLLMGGLGYYGLSSRGHIEAVVGCELDCWPRTIYRRAYGTAELHRLDVFQFPQDDAAFMQTLRDKDSWRELPLPCAVLDERLFGMESRKHVSAMQAAQRGFWYAGAVGDDLFVYDADAHVLYLCMTHMDIREMMRKAEDASEQFADGAAADASVDCQPGDDVGAGADAAPGAAGAEGAGCLCGHDPRALCGAWGAPDGSGDAPLGTPGVLRAIPGAGGVRRAVPNV